MFQRIICTRSPLATISSRSYGIKKDRFGYPIRNPDPETQESSEWAKFRRNVPKPMTKQHQQRPAEQNIGLTKYKQHIESKSVMQLFRRNPSPDIVPRIEYEDGMKRVGMIGRKLGETRSFRRNGDVSLATMIEIQDNYVLAQRPIVQRVDEEEKVVLRVGAFDHDNLEEVPLAKQKEYLAIGQVPKEAEHDFNVSKDLVLPINYKLDISHFFVGQYLDISGTTVNRGFQGVMRRWGHKGQGYCYGRTKTHRRPGSISTQGLARVLKGRKMPGIMGNRDRTWEDKQILYANYEKKYILVDGHVMGVVGCFLFLRDSARMDPIQGPLLHYPTFVGEAGALGTEVYDSSVVDPTWDFQTAYDNRIDRLRC